MENEVTLNFIICGMSNILVICTVTIFTNFIANELLTLIKTMQERRFSNKHESERYHKGDVLQKLALLFPFTSRFHIHIDNHNIFKVNFHNGGNCH